jgi:hypothetical protein
MVPVFKTSQCRLSFNFGFDENTQTIASSLCPNFLIFACLLLMTIKKLGLLSDGISYTSHQSASLEHSSYSMSSICPLPCIPETSALLYPLQKLELPTWSPCGRFCSLYPAPEVQILLSSIILKIKP